jgi:hypothetical protein
MAGHTSVMLVVQNSKEITLFCGCFFALEVSMLKLVIMVMKSVVIMLKLEWVSFQIKKEEDVILDCDLDIIINNDGDVDRDDVVYQNGSTDGVDDEGGRHGVNGCHVVKGVGGG